MQVKQLLSLIEFDADLCVEPTLLQIIADFLEEVGDDRHASVRRLATHWETGCPVGCLVGILPEARPGVDAVILARTREKHAGPVAVYRQVVTALGQPTVRQMCFDPGCGPWVFEWHLGIKKMRAWHTRINKLRTLPGVRHTLWTRQAGRGGKLFDVIALHAPVNLETLCS